MEYLIQHKYIKLPINTDVTLKKVCLMENDALLFDFDCKIDFLNPKSVAYVDVQRFIGKTVKITVEPEIDMKIEFADEKVLEGLWNESLRPKIHYTVATGYNNDPNGLIRYDGIYHMFYQHGGIYGVCIKLRS